MRVSRRVLSMVLEGARRSYVDRYAICVSARTLSVPRHVSQLSARADEATRLNPHVPVALPRSNLLAPACPCSTSVNITPLQRPASPPARLRTPCAPQKKQPHPHTRDSGTPHPQTQLLRSLAWHSMSVRHRKRMVDITPTYRSPVAPSAAIPFQREPLTL